MWGHPVFPGEETLALFVDFDPETRLFRYLDMADSDREGFFDHALAEMRVFLNRETRDGGNTPQLGYPAREARVGVDHGYRIGFDHMPDPSA